MFRNKGCATEGVSPLWHGMNARGTAGHSTAPTPVYLAGGALSQCSSLGSLPVFCLIITKKVPSAVFVQLLRHAAYFVPINVCVPMDVLFYGERGMGLGSSPEGKKS